MLRNPIVISHSKFCKNWPNFAFQSICSFFVLLSITFNNTLAGLELFSRLTRPREDRPMIPPFLSASAPLLSQTHWPCWKDENRGSFLPTQKGTHLKQSMGLRQLWSIEIPKSPPWVGEMGPPPWKVNLCLVAQNSWLGLVDMGWKKNCCCSGVWSCQVPHLRIPLETDATGIRTPSSCSHSVLVKCWRYR